MPNLRDFERRLGGLVEGLFSKTFRSGLQPVEIAKRLVREMEDGRQVGVNEVWAPNRFEVSLSVDDAPRFRQMETALVAELKDVIRETAAERGWGLVGPPEVEFFVDETLRKGDLSCDTSMVEGEDQVAPAAATRPAKLLIHEEGSAREVRMAKGVLTIGRLPDCDVVLKDKGASRRHAQLRVDDDVVTLTDLGSTNGTRLNGQQVQTRVLQDGDKITVGTTVLEFRRE
jgi:Protein of unknown function (DUF3662)/Inner membrane component of T3SS, cytoplasmic domain